MLFLLKYIRLRMSLIFYRWIQASSLNILVNIFIAMVVDLMKSTRIVLGQHLIRSRNLKRSPCHFQIGIFKLFQWIWIIWFDHFLYEQIFHLIFNILCVLGHTEKLFWCHFLRIYHGVFLFNKLTIILFYFEQIQCKSCISSILIVGFCAHVFKIMDFIWVVFCWYILNLEFILQTVKSLYRISKFLKLDYQHSKYK